MNTKQQVATGFLAMVIVGSVAFMPVSAERKDAQAPSVSQSSQVMVVQNSPELPQDQVRDLTYN